MMIKKTAYNQRNAYPSNYSKNSVPMHSQTKSASKGKKKRQNGMIQTYPLYYNKHQKGKALNKIKEGLESNGYSFSTKDIAEKIANLRNYYGA